MNQTRLLSEHSLLCLQLEMILQAQEYEKAQGLNLQEFFDSTKGKFKTELGQSWATEIVARRHAENQHSHDI